MPTLDTILQGLNPEQASAVTHAAGPLLIVAGAGTGKTTVLSRRIAWLIATGRARPEGVLALAFNEKAAQEMEERVDLLLPYGQAPTGIQTFHAYGQRLLEEHGLRLGIGATRVISGAAQRHFLRSRLWRLPLSRFRPLGNPAKHVEELLKAFSRAKDEAVDEAAWARAAQAQLAAAKGEEAVDAAEAQVELAAAYAAYNQLLREEGFLDHGDQLWLALRLLREHPAVLALARAEHPAVLVDEFQDTNHVQAQLLKLLCPPGPEPLLSVVGDDDQAIYGFRGASLDNLLSFKDAYPAARVITLLQNYRNPQDILDAAHRAVAHNDPDRLEARLGIDKRLRGRAPEGDSLSRQAFPRRHDELAFMVAEVQAGLAKGLQLRDHAVLCRSHSLGQQAQAALQQAGLATRYPGEKGLYRQPEVAHALAFVRALADPSDDLALFALLTSGEHAWDLLPVKHLLATARQANKRLWQALRDPALLQAAELGPERLEQAEALSVLLAGLSRLAARQGVAAALYAYLGESGMLPGLLALGAEGERPLANLARFFDRLKEFDQVEKPGNVIAVADYLDALLEEGDDPATEQAGPEDDAVTVSTVHQAKGLEWPVVFVLGLENERFPMKRQPAGLGLPPALKPSAADLTAEHRSEERRLFYVAMTRASQRLWLCHSRDTGGKKATKRSIFLDEALGLQPDPKGKVTLSPSERLERHAPQALDGVLQQPLPLGVDAEGVLRLSYYPVDDYLTCPFKYKIAHHLELKPPPNQSLAYGNAVHGAIQAFHRARMDGQPFGPEDMAAAFKAAWSSAGFDSPEHEQQRFEFGLGSLRAFMAEEDASGRTPWRIESRFDAPIDAQTRVVGRMDRVDREPDGSVCISDYKTSNKDDQKKADEEVRKSLQLGIYALAYEAETGKPPDLLELRFTEHGLRASLKPDAAYMEAKRQDVLRAAAGMRAGDFTATPEMMACKQCSYAGICPYAYGKA